MKKIYFLIILLFIYNNILFSQSLLWEIKGNGLKKSSYLFGTIHIQDKRVFDYGEIVNNKLDSCEAFAMELLLDEISNEEMKKAMLMENTSLEQLLTKSEYDSLATYFKKVTGQSIMLYNKVKPFFISTQIMQLKMNKDNPDALDLHLYKRAKQKNKKLLSIENFSEQIAAVNSIPLKEQAKMLLESLRDTLNEIFHYNYLIELYLKADLENMAKLSKDEKLPETFNQAFLVNRNKKMADRIEKFCKKQSTFCAIGAAHLGGESGVITLLRKKGYIVEPIKTK